MSVLDSAAAGLNTAQLDLGTIAQNLSNANTLGYKSSTALFQQTYQQTLQGGTAPTAATGGTNPQQISTGSSVGLATIQHNFSEGSLVTTGVSSNMAISGNGWFVVNTPQGQAYTRAGAFTRNAAGQLVDPNGDFVMGWSAATVAAHGQNGGNVAPLSIVNNKTLAPKASSLLTAQGNLNASAVGTSAAATTTKSLPITLHDAQGNPINAMLVFSNPQAVSGGGVKWTVNLTPLNSTTPYSGTAGTVVFATGKSPQWSTAPSWTITPTDGSPPLTVNMTNTSIANLTSYAGATTAASSANGYSKGTLTHYQVGSNGIITGTYSNGYTSTLGQVAVALFPNNNGMTMVGNNNWVPSANAGPAQIGIPGTGQIGSVVSGSLEQSNVSLSNQFVQMVVAQQNYAANAKLLTVDQTNRTTLIQSVQ